MLRGSLTAVIGGIWCPLVSVSLQELMKRGADRNIVDKKGRTALDYALKNGEESDIVQLLQSE